MASTDVSVTSFFLSNGAAIYQNGDAVFIWSVEKNDRFNLCEPLIKQLFYVNAL